MSRRKSLSTMEKESQSLDERRKAMLAELQKLDQEQKKVTAEMEAEKERIQTEKFREIGKIVYSYFGEDISAEDFKDKMDKLLSFDVTKTIIENNNIAADGFDPEDVKDVSIFDEIAVSPGQEAND